MSKVFLPILPLILFGCAREGTPQRIRHVLNEVAEKYARLGLAIGQYDPAFVDAYYGPDSFKPSGEPKDAIPRDSLLNAVGELQEDIEEFISTEKNDSIRHRAEWISKQLTAFDRRIRIFTGEFTTFDKESQDLFNAVAPTFAEAQFQAWLDRLDQLLPGEGEVNSRFQQLANRFVIPKDKLDTLFKVTIAECRRRTREHLTLPDEENFVLEYVTDKSWSGYNWYQGNYKSVIQINTDIPILIDRVIDVGSHESYPGHHVYNMLLEKHLYRDKGYLEISMYPLFSPQSLIAEGTANYGIEVVFPDQEAAEFARDILLPLAGLDTAGIGMYFRSLDMKKRLSYARNEVARGLIDSTMNETEALRWLTTYGLYSEESARKSIAFIRENRSYVINYNYGKDLVEEYIETHAGSDPKQRWILFGWLLSHQVSPDDLKR